MNDAKPRRGWEEVYLPVLYDLVTGKRSGIPWDPAQPPRRHSVNHWGARRAAEYAVGGSRGAILHWYASQAEHGHMALHRGRGVANEFGSTVYDWMHAFINVAIRTAAAERGDRAVLALNDDWWVGHVAQYELTATPAGRVRTPGCRSKHRDSIPRDVLHQLLTGRPLDKDPRGKWGHVRGNWAARLVAKRLDQGDTFGNARKRKNLPESLPKLHNPLTLLRTPEGFIAWCDRLDGCANHPLWAVRVEGEDATYHRQEDLAIRTGPIREPVPDWLAEARERVG